MVGGGQDTQQDGGAGDMLGSYEALPSELPLDKVRTRSVCHLQIQRQPLLQAVQGSHQDMLKAGPRAKVLPPPQRALPYLSGKGMVPVGPQAAPRSGESCPPVRGASGPSRQEPRATRTWEGPPALQRVGSASQNPSRLFL